MTETQHQHATVCGFSFGKNLTKLGYPVEAAVRSVLPLCHRFVFVVGRSEDDTRARVAAIDPRVEIIDSVWPEVRVDGGVLAIEANKALAAAQATGCRWGFYIQADEVVHEDDLEGIGWSLREYADQPEVKALLFRYLHFMLDYETVDPWMYHKASRVVRLDSTCEIVADACGPALKGYKGAVNRGNGYLDKHHLGGHVRWAGRRGLAGVHPRIFHYGWVKTREQLGEKFAMVESLWWGTLDAGEKERRKNNKFGGFIERYPILKKFHGSHPKVMRELVAAHPAYARVPRRWLNPRFYGEVLRHGFAG